MVVTEVPEGCSDWLGQIGFARLHAQPTSNSAKVNLLTAIMRLLTQNKPSEFNVTLSGENKRCKDQLSAQSKASY
jgi:hypothetical protein